MFFQSYWQRKHELHNHSCPTRKRVDNWLRHSSEESSIIIFLRTQSARVLTANVVLFPRELLPLATEKYYWSSHAALNPTSIKLEFHASLQNICRWTHFLLTFDQESNRSRWYPKKSVFKWKQTIVIRLFRSFKHLLSSDRRKFKETPKLRLGLANYLTLTEWLQILHLLLDAEGSAD